MKRLLLAAAAVSCLAVPALASAQDRGPDRGDRGNRGQRGASAAPDVGQVRRGVPNPDFQRDGAPPRQDFDGQRQDDRGRDYGQAQRDDRGGRDQFRDGPDRGPRTAPPQAERRPYDRNDRFERNNRPGRNDRWDDRGPRWSRNDPNWWRGRPEFRGYSGPRSGFWFFPNYGYIRPEPRFYGYVWRRGDFVPPTYRRYTVADPYLYGLDWPPPGYAWVYLGRDIVLMQMATGRIVDVVVGVF